MYAYKCKICGELYDDKPDECTSCGSINVEPLPDDYDHDWHKKLSRAVQNDAGADTGTSADVHTDRAEVHLLDGRTGIIDSDNEGGAE